MKWSLRQIAMCMFLLATAALFNCSESSTPPDVEETPLSAPPGFEYDTRERIDVRFEAFTTNGQPLHMIQCNVYPTAEELNASEPTHLFRGFTDVNGIVEGFVELEKDQDSLFFEISYVGQLNTAWAAVEGNSMTFVLGDGIQGQPKRIPKQPDIAFQRTVAGAPVLDFIGSYNSSGLPDYLETTVVEVNNSLVEKLNETLPEQVSVVDYFGDYLDDGNETHIIIEETTDLTLTFLHEGAIFDHLLAYYTYPTDSPPGSESDIDTLTVILPRVSYDIGLEAGHQINLGTFEKGTSVGFAAVLFGWFFGNPTTGTDILYSDAGFNPGDVSEKPHNLLFKSPVSSAKQTSDDYLVAIELAPRNFISDEDFNDILFMVSADEGAVNDAAVASLANDAPDCDNDGIADFYDAFPCDENAALQVWTNWSTVAFDDEWPSLGDLDYNDLIIDYRFVVTCDYDLDILDFIGTFVLKAQGTEKSNGFALELPFSPDLVASVSGNEITENYISFNSNGTESGQDNAVIVIFDNGLAQMTPPDSGIGINTEKGYRFQSPDTISVQVVFSEPLSGATFGWPPFNPFLIVNQERGREIHFNNAEPTNLADGSLFGSEDDASDAATGTYYRSSGNLTWALDIPKVWEYPFEGDATTDAYTYFSAWVTSGGATNSDWYNNWSGYQDESKIYTPFGIGKRIVIRK